MKIILAVAAEALTDQHDTHASVPSDSQTSKPFVFPLICIVIVDPVSVHTIEQHITCVHYSAAAERLQVTCKIKVDNQLDMADGTHRFLFG